MTETTILYLLEPHGGFLVGDPASGLTAYAYPTSVYATSAQRQPARVAVDMLRGERLSKAPRDAARDAAWLQALRERGTSITVREAV